MTIEMSTASKIWELLEDEGEANKGYTEFLACFGNNLSQDHKVLIEEIISEEAKHVVILMNIAQDLTGIRPEGN